jgi:RNA polymerase sigma-70 factor (ECF subfamily)
MGIFADQLLATGVKSMASTAPFTALMVAEQRRVFVLCQRLLNDREEADSATQDVFLKAWRAMERDGLAIDEPARWLTRVAVNTCLDRLRSKRWQIWRRRPASQDEATILSMVPARSPSSEDRYFALEIGRRLTHALGNLSARQRAVFTLRHFEEMSLEEIAATLSLDVGTVKAHLSRSLAKLREELKDLYLLRKAQTKGESK